MKNKYGSYIIGGKKIPFKNWEGKEWKSDSNEIWFYTVVLLAVIGYLGFMIVGGYYWL